MYYRSFRKAIAVFICGAFILSSVEFSSRQNAMASTHPFELSEQLVYEGQFSKLLVRNLNVVELKFTVGRTPIAETAQNFQLQPTNLLFTGEATAKGFFAKLFGLHFHYRSESTVDPQSLTVLRTNTLDEQGKRRRTSETVFDRATNRIIWTQRNPDAAAHEAPRIIESPMGDANHDLISALYYLRTLTLKPRAQFELVLSDSGRVYRVPVRVVETKRIKSVLGNVFATRIDLEVFGKNRPVQGTGRMSLWLTNDKRRIPVLARITTDIGTLELTLKNATSGVAN